MKHQKETLTTYHKSIRLPRDRYSESNRPFFITMCTANKTPLFSNPTVATKMWELIIHGHLTTHSKLICTCLMPDHLHTIQIPTRENLVDLVGRWKSYTATFMRRKFKIHGLWQHGFFDRAVRKEEDLVKLAEYVIHNPVRAGLVDSVDNYRYIWHIWQHC